MPLTINVSLGRKSSRNFQSSSTSISIAAELDQSLLAKPQQLQKEIDSLFEQAQVALDSQENEPLPAEQGELRRTLAATERNGGGYRRNGDHPGNGSRSRPASITDSQRRAIHAISSRVEVDPYAESRQITGIELDQLSVREASELIDHLRAPTVTVVPRTTDKNGSGDPVHHPTRR